MAPGHEAKVREHFDAAGPCYETLIGHTWHHGDPAAEARGCTVVEACRQLEDDLIQIAGLGPGGRALDFGSGIGGPTLHMAAFSGASFVGLSNNEWLNQRARYLASALDLEHRVSFLTTGDEDYRTLVAFADGTFDAITFFESVCHLPDKAAFFRAAHRVLRPGARIVGIDRLQRPFAEHLTEAHIMKVMAPVNEHFCIPAHGTLASYRQMLEAAGFVVEVARDMFEGVQCWGSTPTEDRDAWLAYDGPEAQRFRAGKLALDAARDAGVFTVGMFVAQKRG
jgi:tocopherol O-methyltransferase